MAIATTINKTSLLQNNANPQPDTLRNTFNVVTLAAAGTVQADATAIGNVAPFVIVSNNTAANGLVLPAAAYIGQEITIYPALITNAPKIYPPVGGTINSGAVNASVATTARKAVQYTSIDRTGLNWVTNGL